MSEIEHLLAHHDLKKTATRKSIVEVFLNNEHAISQRQIEEQLGDPDRVTIYRTLNTFEEKGLIHRIIASDNEVRYAMCKDNCSTEQHVDNHLHFNCTDCGKTYCLSVEIPPLNMPQNYKVKNAHVLVEGICERCV